MRWTLTAWNEQWRQSFLLRVFLQHGDGNQLNHVTPGTLYVNKILFCHQIRLFKDYNKVLLSLLINVRIFFITYVLNLFSLINVLSISCCSSNLYYFTLQIIIYYKVFPFLDTEQGDMSHPPMICFWVNTVYTFTDPDWQRSCLRILKIHVV